MHLLIVFKLILPNKNNNKNPSSQTSTSQNCLRGKMVGMLTSSVIEH